MRQQNQYLKRNVGNSEQGCRGFSLLQVVVAAAILAILAAVGIPMLNSAMENMRVGAAASKIASDIRLAQQRAISTACPTEIFFSAPNSYQLRTQTGANCTGPVVAVVGVLPDSVWGTVNIGTLYPRVSFAIAGAPNNFGGDNVLQFNSRGGTADQGTLNFSTTAGAFTRVVTLLPPTGRVRVCRTGPC